MIDKGLEFVKKKNYLQQLDGTTQGSYDRCLAGKQRASFASSDNKTTQVLEFIHFGVCGLMEMKSLGS